MPRGLMVVQTNPVDAGREQEYNRWYDTQHLPDVVGVPGIAAAARYRAALKMDFSGTTPVADDAPLRYLAVYELDVDDFQALAERLREAGSGMATTDALDPAVQVTFYELITERLESST